MISTDEILAAMNDFFSAWHNVKSVPWVLPRRPTEGYVGIEDEGMSSMDGSFDAKALAQHIADALNGTPRATFDRVSKEVAAAMGAEDSLTQYQKEWERDGQWFLGEGLLSDIVFFLQGKPLVATVDEIDHSRINLSIQLPTVRDDITGDRVSVFYMIPEELREKFESKSCEIASHFYSDFNQDYMGRQITQFALANVNAELLSAERNREARAEGEIWKYAALVFGLDWRALPRPAGIAA